MQFPTLWLYLPVLIVYGTAIVPENGSAEFFQDIYGLDKKLEKLIMEANAAKT